MWVSPGLLSEPSGPGQPGTLGPSGCGRCKVVPRRAHSCRLTRSRALNPQACPFPAPCPTGPSFAWGRPSTERLLGLCWGLEDQGTEPGPRHGLGIKLKECSNMDAIPRKDHLPPFHRGERWGSEGRAQASLMLFLGWKISL